MIIDYYKHNTNITAADPINRQPLQPVRRIQCRTGAIFVVCGDLTGRVGDPAAGSSRTTSYVRIPMKPAMHSDFIPATHSETKPATVPI